jgi:uncharacterized repeat protein (TIGR01451 family)
MVNIGIAGGFRRTTCLFLALLLLVAVTTLATAKSADAGTTPAPALTISKVPDSATINAGDQIGFTITVSNIGNVDAFNVSVGDFLNFVLVNDVHTWVESPDNPNCSVANNLLLCSANPFPAGSNPIVVHVSTQTTPKDCGTASNTVNLSWTDALSGGYQSSAESSVTIVCPTETETATLTATEEPTETFVPTEVPTDTATATSTVVGGQNPTDTPTATAEGNGGQNETPEVSPTATATSNPNENVNELPNTGATPNRGGGSGLIAAGIIAALLAALGLLMKRRARAR